MKSDQKRIQTAMDSVMEVHGEVKDDPSRPQYHLLPPSMWMNDPNGPIFYNNKYHLFYQHQPFKPKWGIMYWGHAESTDLLNWTHLPIALAPDKENGEKYCFSGCCVDNNGIPTILYTSIKSLGFGVIFGAQTWSASSDSDLVEWRRNPSNPILDRSIHKNERVRQIRDPYIWKEGGLWHLALGGQLTRPWRGAVFHYTSPDLETWNYIGTLCEGNPKTHRKPWECPNVLKWGDISVILISPFDKVQYSVFQNMKQESEWKIFDHGKSFYAPNSMKNPDDEQEYILWGWIKGGGLKKQWNGCFTIPRVISLEHKELRIRPSPIIEKLRNTHHYFEEQSAILNFHEGCGEIIIKFAKDKQCTLEIYNNPGKKYTIHYNPKSCTLQMGNENAYVQSNSEIMKLHLFVDRSVLELFINDKECFTSRFYPDDYKDIIIDCKVPGMELTTVDGWGLSPISQEFPSK